MIGIPQSVSNLVAQIKPLHLLIGSTILVGCLALAVSRLNQSPSSATAKTSSAAAANTGGSVPQPLARRELNESFSFDLPNKEPSDPSVTYTIESAETYKEILVQGQLAQAAPGRTFLVFIVKIVNPTPTTFTINTRDYIRLTIGDNQETLAPEIHSDPVEVQAISTKYTRLGFPVDENATHFKVSIGEIKGQKRAINLSF